MTSCLYLAAIDGNMISISTLLLAQKIPTPWDPGGMCIVLGANGTLKDLGHGHRP
uniref:Uncharacterized protein n=1 Tax=Arundo donax TaxID=35708 RepID=A0A0A9AFW7_ARUDO